MLINYLTTRQIRVNYSGEEKEKKSEDKTEGEKDEVKKEKEEEKDGEKSEENKEEEKKEKVMVISLTLRLLSTVCGQ